MRTTLGQMDGNEWERYCQDLLRLRYRDDYQEVPAQYGGDLGIEGFTRSGLVFQCYCPDEDPSGDDLYEAQRNKITRDINKLTKNAAEISKLGAGKIKEWQFLSPRYNSRHLIEHCRTKEAEVLALNLPTIDRSFRIMLRTENDYIPERQIFLEAAGLKIQPKGIAATPETIAHLVASNNVIVSNIHNKLRKLPVSTEYRATLTEEMIRNYVAGQGELQSLNENFPSTYRSVVQLKTAVESQLATRVLSGAHDGAVLEKVLDYYEARLSKDFSNSLSTALIMQLSSEAISDWLGRCPLNFPEAEGR